MISIVEIARSAAFKRVERASFSSALPPLMAALGDEGVLSGQTVEWSGSTYCGKTGVLRFWVSELCRKGVAVAWIDSYQTLDAKGFSSIESERFWMVRPVKEMDAPFCAETLIRSSCFGMVILELTPRQPARRVRRLQQLAKTHDVILLWVHECTDTQLGGVVAHRIRVVGTHQKVDSPLADWCSPQLRVSLDNLKRQTPRIGYHRNLNLMDTPRLHGETWIELSDRRTSASTRKTMEVVR